MPYRTYTGQDRPDIGNTAWLIIGAMEETTPAMQRRLEPVRQYMALMENECRTLAKRLEAVKTKLTQADDEALGFSMPQQKGA